MFEWLEIYIEFMFHFFGWRWVRFIAYALAFSFSAGILKVTIGKKIPFTYWRIIEVSLLAFWMFGGIFVEYRYF